MEDEMYGSQNLAHLWCVATMQTHRGAQPVTRTITVNTLTTAPTINPPVFNNEV